MDLSQALENSQKIVAEYWPLQSFIAVNPLWDCTQNDFVSMLQKFSVLDPQQQKHLQQQPILFSQQIDEYQFQPAFDYIQQRCLTTLSELFSRAAKLSTRQQYRLSGYKAWLSWLDASDSKKQILHGEDRIAVIQHLLQQLNVATEIAEDYFCAIYQSLYGFASLCKWMNKHPQNPWLSFEYTLTDIVILWLWHEVQLANEIKLSHIAVSRATNEPINYTLEEDIEQSYQKHLLDQLKTPHAVNNNADLQAIFCIDTRSELLRRHLEETASIETFGFAGFFGFAFILQDKAKRTLQCPALLTPETIINVQKQQKRLVKFAKNCDTSIEHTKKGMFASLNLFELFGLWQLFAYLGKTFVPTLWHTIANLFRKKPFRQKHLDLKDFPLQQATDAAWLLLTTIGLTKNFAKSIVICAHQSVSENNPYASSLDCGACGGNSGKVNAMVAAEMLNHTAVRQQLANKGINIPTSTHFIAACHNTTYDQVTLYDANKTINAIFTTACAGVRQEKQQRFPMLTKLKMRQYNWSELVPEYALVNNAAMIIGPRSLTLQKNLQGRVFLHSYQPESDPDGDILESIMLAPMIVAHWINMQYYFSTVLPSHFSAGNKAIHNIIPGIGVMEGNFSDLKIGLPEQSIRYRGQVLHTPQRLTVIIDAPQASISRILNKHPKLSELVRNHWLFIYSHDGDDFLKVSL